MVPAQDPALLTFGWAQTLLVFYTTHGNQQRESCSSDDVEADRILSPNERSKSHFRISPERQFITGTAERYECTASETSPLLTLTRPKAWQTW